MYSHLLDLVHAYSNLGGAALILFMLLYGFSQRSEFPKDADSPLELAAWFGATIRAVAFSFIAGFVVAMAAGAESTTFRGCLFMLVAAFLLSGLADAFLTLTVYRERTSSGMDARYMTMYAGYVYACKTYKLARDSHQAKGLRAAIIHQVTARTLGGLFLMVVFTLLAEAVMTEPDRSEVRAVVARIWAYLLP